MPDTAVAGAQQYRIAWPHPHALATWFFESGLRIGFILLLGYSIIRVVTLIVAGIIGAAIGMAGGPLPS